MFPSFSSKQDRENKRQALLERYTQDLQNDELKRQAYATTLWASDQEKNSLSLLSKSRTTLGTQTDTTSTSNGTQTSSNNSSGPPSVDPTVRLVLNDLVNRVADSNHTSNGTQTSSNNSDQRSHGSSRAYTTSDVPTQSTSEDIGDEDETMSDIDDKDESDQVHSKAWLQALYHEFPELSTAGYNVVRKQSDIPDRNYVLFTNAMVYNKMKRKKARKDIVESVDWVKTAQYVEELVSNQGVNVSREIANMLDEDKDAPYINYLKRRPRTQKRGQVTKYHRIGDAGESGNDTSNDQLQAHNDLFDLYVSNEDDLDRLGVNLIDENQDLISGFTLMLNKPKTSLIIAKNSGSRKDHNPSVEKHVSWVYTLQYIVQRLAGARGNTRTPRGWQQRADHTVDTGISTQVNTDAESKQMIGQIHKNLPWIDTLDIKLVQNYKDGPRLSDSYKFGDNMEIYTIKQNRKISGKAKNDILKQINWQLTLNQVIEAIVQYDDILTDVMSDRDINLKESAPEEFDRMNSKRREIGAVVAKLGDIKRAYGMGLNKRIIGRGLKGAGIGLKGYSGTSKNLRSIQGSGTASDLKYKQLGSKFIRITDLRQDQPRLKLVYANRTQVGRIIDISKPLAKCIEHLVFEQDVNRQMYNKLKINDKQIIHDLLRLCHLDTTFLNPISDPLEQLQAEFDKLRSQVMLGNDNPDNIKELKTLSLDLYNKKLINDDQMHEILSL